MKSEGKYVTSKCWDSFLTGLLYPAMTHDQQVKRQLQLNRDPCNFHVSTHRLPTVHHLPNFKIFIL